MDNKNSILLIDPTFDPTKASSCDLIVKVGSKSFSYAIINAETKKISAVYDEQECEDGAKKLVECLKNDSYLALPYRTIKIAAHTSNIIHIPSELFTEENLSHNAQFFTEKCSENLYVNEQVHFGFHAIFAFSTYTDEAINFTSGKKLLVNDGLLAIAEQLQGPTLFLDFSVGTVNILYINNKQVVFQQCYEIDNAEEFNYYLLLILNQLEISATTSIYLSGIVHENDDNYNCINKYFNTVQFLTVAEELDQQVMDDMPAHYYSSLLALYQCV